MEARSTKDLRILFNLTFLLFIAEARPVTARQDECDPHSGTDFSISIHTLDAFWFDLQLVPVKTDSHDSYIGARMLI